MNRSNQNEIKILVVEDDKFVVRLIVEKLRESGYEVDSVKSGAMALEKAAIEKYDLLLVDYLLPDMTGKEIIHLMKEAGNEKPFIIMTGYGNERIAVEMMKLGAMDYVPKDTSFITLITTVVDRVVDQIRTKDQLHESRRELTEVNRRYRELFENSLDPIYLTSDNGRLVEYNRTFIDLFEFSPAELDGMKFIDLIKYDEAKNDYIEMMETHGHTLNFETVLKSKSGRDIQCILKTVRSTSERGVYLGRQGIIHDITYLKSAEAEVKKLNRELEQRVQMRTSQLEEALKKLKLEISVRKKMAEELMHMKNLKADALEKEKELSELKTRLISMISHEYRTPLTIVLTSTNLIERFLRMGQNAEIIEYLGKIRSTINLMAQLLEDVLTIGKSDAGKLKVMPEEIRLDELCRTTFEELETIDSKRHKFDLTTDKQPFLIRSDEMMIKQILNNLISNAMKYSPANSKICIDLSEHENKFEMKISDNGIGIPEDDRNKLFETFHRGSNTGTIKGTGLGLAIVQRCVSSLRGSIEFDSELYKGTTFSVRLPMHLE